MKEILFPEELPVSAHREEIAKALKNHQVIIVAGETGSGKTTQLPKIALSIGRKRIAHTQPRRIAARAVAERVAEELQSELGDEVGYQVRFTDRVAEHTKIRVMTDGILLAQTHRDRNLKRYDTIIIDEAHERSLNIDFLLGYLKRLLPKRPDLKVIITSATIDPESFAKHFSDKNGNPAPVIEVSGRTYPVEVRYRPLTGEDLIEGVASSVKNLVNEARGDILVFLSGESEIRDAQDALRGMNSANRSGKLEVLPLYGRLSAADQHRVFSKAAPGSVRVILATNVAETSLTVPGIKYVVDAGYARISRWSPRSKVQRLPIEAISQASANQRSGRAGRLSAGIAIRLYSEEDFNSQPEFTDPEILRTGLASVILQMMSLGIGDITKFPFLTPPDKRGVNAGIQLLTELGAIRNNKITRTGKTLARIPIEPRFGRMLVEAFRFGVTTEVTALVAGLTIQDVRERPEEEKGKADHLHARFADPQGDLMTLLNLWNYLSEKRAELSSSAFRRLCRAEFLNYMRVREWFDLVRQLEQSLTGLDKKTVELLKESAVTAPASGSTAESVHRACLSGLLSQLGLRDDTQKRDPKSGRQSSQGSSKRRPAQEYAGSRGTRFVIHPGSVLSKKPPETIMSVELVETSRLFARANAVIDLSWAEYAAPHLVRSQLSSPHWSKDRGAATAYEKLTLFGIPIVERRAVPLSRTDPDFARELFIRHALVDGEWVTHESFDRANWQLRRELEALEARERRRDLVAHDDAIFAFFDDRVPRSVTSVRDFEGWWRKTKTKSPKLLHLTRDILLDNSEDVPDESAFPRVWSFGEQNLKLKYRFDPSAEDDGVSVQIPLPLLPGIADTDLANLVPGMRLELVEALIRSLPKSIRKGVVPVAQWAKKFLPNVENGLRLNPGTGVAELLAKEVRMVTSLPVTPNDFDFEKIPKHLTPSFSVVDNRGRTIGKSRELADLKKKFKDKASSEVAGVANVGSAIQKSPLTKKGLTVWDFDDIPQVVETKFSKRSGSGLVRAFPALLDRGRSVDLILATSSAEQKMLHRKGLRRLVQLSAPSTASYLNEHLSNDEKLLLSAGPFNGIKEALDEALLVTATESIEVYAPDGLFWDKETFELVADNFSRQSVTGVFETLSLISSILREAREAKKAVDNATSLAVVSQVSDAKSQLTALISRGFVSSTPPDRLKRFPIYMRAITHRMQELTSRAQKDRGWQNEFELVAREFVDRGGSFQPGAELSQTLDRTRWLLEEYRVSLFAQHLGTSEPVSRKRILQVLNEQESS